MTPRTLLSDGPWSRACADHRKRLQDDIARLVLPRIDAAETANLYPGRLILDLAARGHFRERWTGGEWGDQGRGVLMFHELGRHLAGGLALGLSLHMEVVSSILHRARPKIGGRDLFEEAMTGRLIGCFGLTERTGGSAVGAIQTRAERTSAGWVINGHKKYMSLTKNATMAFVVARTGGEGLNGLSLFAVPSGEGGYRIAKTFDKLGTRSLETTEVVFEDVEVPTDHLIGEAGNGMALALPALTVERMAAAAVVIGTLEGCLELARAHLQKREGPQRLWNHQVLRHRWAEWTARAETLRQSLLYCAWGLEQGHARETDAAALKLIASQEAERGVSEALQFFGGSGYTTEFPLERALRDVRLARVGAGTDDIMRELVSGVYASSKAYDLWVAERRLA